MGAVATRPYAPDLVAATRARLPPQMLTRILGVRLGQVSIRDLETILNDLIMVEAECLWTFAG
jgi:hypothetical protein